MFIHMDKTQMKAKIQNDWPLFLTAFFVTLVMRYFCRTSDTDVLRWILAPTARWAGILGGISFEYLPHQGYVNHGYQFLIAASCSGSRFMLLTFLMLLFMPVCKEFYRCGNVCLGRVLKESNDLHRLSAKRNSVCGTYRWLVSSLILAYFLTIFVNGIRIVLSIRLPVILEKLNLLDGWLTPDRLHTLIGTVTYFTALCMLYLSAASTTERNGLFVPAFWYLLIVLVLPFVKRAWRNEWAGFGEYAVLIIGACMAVCVIFLVLGRRTHQE